MGQPSAKVVAALNGLKAVVKDRGSVTSRQIVLVASLLSDIPEDLCLAAIRAAATESTFFPTPGEIRERIVSPKALALESWVRVRTAIRRLGAGGDPATMLKPLDLDAVEAVGGWRHLCMCETSQLSFVERSFFQAYLTLYARSTLERQLPPGKTVAGLLEALEESST